MTKEFSYLFGSAMETMIAGGLPAKKAEELLTSLISESDRIVAVIDAEEKVELSDREYDLCREMVSLLAHGGTNEGHAILLTAMLMAAVEERVRKNMRA